MVVALMAMGVFNVVRAGGLLTNSNQSASFLRNPAREAVIDVDALYTNPAGVAFMDKGWHFGLTGFNAHQQRDVVTTFPLFAANMEHPGETSRRFYGDALAPVAPCFQAAYVSDKWAPVSGDDILAEGYELLGIVHIHLVAAYVDVGAVLTWYFVEELLQAGLQHSHTLLRRHAEAEGVLEVIAMSGHVYLRYHHYAALLGIAYDVADVVIAVEHTFLPALAHVLGLVQLGVCLAFYAPSRVVGQVPVEGVQLVERKQVYVFQ